VRKSQKAIESAVRALEQQFKRPPSESEIAAHMNMALPEYQHFLHEAKGAQLVYLEEASGDDGEEGFLQRSLPSCDAQPLDRLGDRQFRAALIERIEQLPEREKLVMGLYYDEGLNLKEIGAVLGVTESRVSQIHSQAVARLRSQLQTWL
jgi:RNA polymerase sigma factor for flagellar operon FliA